MEQAPVGLYRLKDIAPDQFQRNEYHAAYYQRTTLVDEIVYVGYPSDGVSVHIYLGRDASSGRRFTSRDLTMADSLVPIVSGLIRRHWSGLESSGDYSEEDVTDRLIVSAQEKIGVKLSPRQAEVALLILRGHSSVSIGLKLGISFQTVKVIRKQLYRKCNISSQAELFSLLLPLFLAPEK